MNPLTDSLSHPQLSSSTFLMDDHDKAYGLWHEAGIKNRILLHFDAHIDFEWIADKDPLRVLKNKPWPEALSELETSYGWSFSNPVNNFLHLGNYLQRALSEGMIKMWYWIVPDSIWENPKSKKQIWNDLMDYYRYRTGPMTPPLSEGDFFLASFFNIPFVATSLKNLPRFQEPVLFNIDVDYLTTRHLDRIPAPQSLRRQLPWIWPDAFISELKKTSVTPLMTTVSNSVQGGFTPIQFKFFGESIRELIDQDKSCSSYNNLKNAFSLLADNRDNDALARLESFEAQGVFEAARLYLKARTLYEKNQISQAREAFAKAVEEDPEFSSSYNSQARYYESAGMPGYAYEEHKMIRELLPGQIEARIGEASYFAASGERQKAKKLLHGILQENPGSAATTNLLGMIYAQEAQWASAERYLNSAVILNPKDLAARIELGHALLRQKKYGDAKTCLREALGAGAHFPRTYFLLSKVYARLGFFKKSFELYLTGLKQKIKVWAAARFKD